MQFKKEDNTLGVVVTSLIEKTDGTCPTDEEFALYMEGKLNKERRKAVISHFVSCRECRERLTIPARPLESEREPQPAKGFLESLWRPLAAAPVAVVLIALLAFSLNAYLKSQGVLGERNGEKWEERYRGADLVALKQIDLTPSLLNAIKEKDEEKLKEELIKELPPGSEVSHIFVEDKLEYLKEVGEGNRINLILYSNGLLKVKLE